MTGPSSLRAAPAAAMAALSTARAAQLRANQRVHITVEGGRVIITPQRDQPATLAERLALFDPALHGGEAMPAAPVGREVW
jgi:antitoxin MazE